jgi:hypothetical protein
MIRSVTRSTIGKTTSRVVGGGAAGGSPAALDILAHVGTSTSPTSTGTKAVTGVGFTPKVVMPFSMVAGNAFGDGATTLASLMIGAAVSPSNNAAIWARSTNGLTTSSTSRRHSGSKCISTDSPVVVEADLDSFDSDGFTLDYTNPYVVAALLLNHICLGGADLEISLTQHQMNATNDPQSFAHGLSGAPTGLLFFSVGNPTTPPATSGVLIHSIGVWSDSGEFSASLYAINGVTTSSTRRRLSDSGVLAFHGGGSGSINRSLSVASVDASNTNCVYPITNTSTEIYFWMLAIRGAKCQVGTFDCNGSLDPLTIATPGITPKLFLPIFLPGGVDNINTVQNGLLLSIGASDGTANVSCGVSDLNGVTTTNARRSQSSTSLCEYDSFGTKGFEGTATFGEESVILDPTTNASSVFGQGGYLVIGS